MYPLRSAYIAFKYVQVYFRFQFTRILRFTGRIHLIQCSNTSHSVASSWILM